MSVTHPAFSQRSCSVHWDPPTYLAGGHHVPVLGVLVHCEAEDVVRVLQVEALAPWERDAEGEPGS